MYAIVWGRLGEEVLQGAVRFCVIICHVIGLCLFDLLPNGEFLFFALPRVIRAAEKRFERSSYD